MRFPIGRTIRAASLAIIAILAFGCSSNGQDAAPSTTASTLEAPPPAEVTVTDIRAEATSEAHAIDVFMKVTNAGARDDILVSVAVNEEAAERAEVMDAGAGNPPGVVDDLDFAGTETIDFAADSYFVRIYGSTGSGPTELTLLFALAGPVAVDVPAVA